MLGASKCDTMRRTHHILFEPEMHYMSQIMRKHGKLKMMSIFKKRRLDSAKNVNVTKVKERRKGPILKENKDTGNTWFQDWVLHPEKN